MRSVWELMQDEREAQDDLRNALRSVRQLETDLAAMRAHVAVMQRCADEALRKLQQALRP